uniref:GRAM domain-containing protein n=1 Tax=Trypanosoma congolense (strain IL3000) TaxID=1068625 RepID=G0UTX7_TRYCI|nr:conserved hypothetical protein [Trypanosoma congolense IL3000]
MEAFSRKPRQEGSCGELQPLAFSGPIPIPHPPCTDPTPDEQYRQISEERLRKLKEHEQELAKKSNTSGASAGASTSFLTGTANSLCNMMQRMSLEVERATLTAANATEAKVREINEKMNHASFKENFPELCALGEVLLCDYPCKAVHAGGYVSGRLYITAGYLCFSTAPTSIVGKTKGVFKSAALDGVSTADPIIRLIVPYTDVASVQLSVHLETLNKEQPFFMLLPSPTVIPTCLQIFTTHQQVLQFFSFGKRDVTDTIWDAVKGGPVDHAYNYIDHAWRAATKVPLSDDFYGN